MFRFYKFEYVLLLLLSLIIFIHLLRSFYTYRSRILKIFSESIIYRITRNYSLKRVLIYVILCSGALVVMSVGVMSPQYGKRLVDVKKKGIDIIIALDVSRSMLAQDILPSRLERAKLELMNLISSLKGDRVGVILFAGQSFMQVPLTTDYDAARLFLRNVGVDSVPVQGTNFRSAFQLARDVFINNQESGGARVLLMLTDGEDHEGNYDSLVEEFKSLQIKVFAIGIATLTGEPIPESGESGKGYKKDKSGQVVISRLNEGVLRKITSNTGGMYIQGSNKEMGMPLIIEELRNLKKGEITTKEVYEYLDRYYVFAFLSLGILLYAFIILPFTKGMRSHLNLIYWFIVVIAISGFSPFMRENPDNKKGNEFYQKGKYKEAIDSYDNAKKRLGHEPLLYFNKAAALIKEKRYNEANEELKKALVGADNKLKSKIFYNMGNLFLEQQKYDEAIESYIKSIQADKEFLDPKHNLEMVLRMLKEQKNEQKSENQEDQKKNEEEEKKDERARSDERRDEEGNQTQDEKRDLAKAEQLLNSLKDKETEQPFNKFLIKEFDNINVEKDW
ncbi:MAG: VWA domain-containing protein [Deltaproteobacteria bacterium]|nr:VWA domain-containing protein [Deltaproteobacteria bacterium]